MRRASLFLTLVSIVASMSGCTICCSPYDFDYMSSGTKLQRTDMTHGRVGSNLSDPNLSVIESSPSDLNEYVDPIEVIP